MPLLKVESNKPSVLGWRYLWMKYVSGFAPSRHCAGCLVGPYSDLVKIGMPTNTVLDLSEHPGADALYLCGVASYGGWKNNLHIVMEPKAGSEIRVQASTGDVFVVAGARQLDIPWLEDGFDGRPRSFTTCRNFQWAVSRYGLSPRPRAKDAPGPLFCHPAK